MRMNSLMKIILDDDEDDTSINMIENAVILTKYTSKDTRDLTFKVFAVSATCRYLHHEFYVICITGYILEWFMKKLAKL